MDYDTENFIETLEILEQSGIRYGGGGRDIREARQPLIMEAKGTRVAFVGYIQFADLFWDFDHPKSFAAADGVPGVAGIREDWLAEDIAQARSQSHVVIVTFHWGEEYVHYPNEKQRKLARLSIDLGADLVIGHHPHAIRGFELYRGGFIAYSAGDFTFDWQPDDMTRIDDSRF